MEGTTSSVDVDVLLILLSTDVVNKYNDTEFNENMFIQIMMIVLWTYDT